MIKNVRTYKELITERKRLKDKIEIQKLLIKADIGDIKHELKPLGNVFHVIGNLTTRDTKNPLLIAGLDMLIDLIFRRMILSRAGWITKLAVPFFVKNYSSHILSDDKAAGLFEKFTNLFKKKRKDSQPDEPHPTPEQMPYSTNNS